MLDIEVTLGVATLVCLFSYLISLFCYANVGTPGGLTNIYIFKVTKMYLLF